MSGAGNRARGPRRSLDDGIAGAAEGFEDHGHTLSAMQGRGLRNELSSMALRGVDGFEGEDALGAEGVSPRASPLTSPNTTPSTTLTGDEQVSLSRAIAADPMARRTVFFANRRDSAPDSSNGHARLSASLFAATPMGAIGEDHSVHGEDHLKSKTRATEEDEYKNQLDASDDETEVNPSDVRIVGEPDRSEGRRMDRTGRDAPPLSSNANAMRNGARAKHTAVFDVGLETRVRADSVDAGDRRDALRSVARDVESLMLISDALSAMAKPVLAKRLREGLGRIQNNARQGYTNEGLHARRQSALKRVNRNSLFREAAADFNRIAASGIPRVSVRFAPRMSVNFASPTKKAGSVSGSLEGDRGSSHEVHKPLTFKAHCVRAAIVGATLLILCCVPHIARHYSPESTIAATTGSYETSVDGSEILLPLARSFRGLYEITLGAGKCDAYAKNTTDHDTTDDDGVPGSAPDLADHESYYVAKVALTQDGIVLREDFLKLHDLGAKPLMHARRALLSGASDSGPVGADVHETFYFDVDPSSSGSGLSVSVKTDCPTPLGISLEALSIGPVGTSQHWIALALLILIFALIITEVVHRTLIAFAGAAAVLFVLALEHRLPSVFTIVQWMDHGTLALLWGMMIIVALLARSGIFEYASVRLIEASGMDLWRLTWMLMLFDCVLSAFLDNVSTMLLLGPVIVSLCRAIDMDPRPMLIPMALFGNIGGTSTMIGDPPNLIIGNAFPEELGFVDFLRVLAPGVLLTLPPALLFLRWYYGKEVYGKKISVDMEELKKKYPIRDHALLARCGIILGFVLLLFFLHPVLHFEPAYAAVFGAIAILLMGTAADFEHALEKVEWDSLLFFAGLFVFTQGVAELGLLRIIADQLSTAIEAVAVEKRAIVSSVMIQIVSACASAFVDNIPFTTTMIPVISRMAQNVEGLTIQPLAWALCFGADYGGMGTLIGASANVVMAGVAAEAGYPVSFMSFFKIGWPMMCLSICVSVPYLALMIHLGYVA